MPRKARITVTGAIHHIMSRGIEGRPIFRDVQDRRIFLANLESQLGKTGYLLYAWCLMETGLEASAFRTGLKNAFRLGLNSTYRQPNLAKYPTDALLRTAAGRTNLMINTYGFGVGVSGLEGGLDW